MENLDTCIVRPAYSCSGYTIGALILTSIYMVQVLLRALGSYESFGLQALNPNLPSEAAEGVCDFNVAGPCIRQVYIRP